MPFSRRWRASVFATLFVFVMNPPAAAAAEAEQPAPDAAVFAPPYKAGLDFANDRRPLDGSYRYLPPNQWGGLYVGALIGGAWGGVNTTGLGLGEFDTSGLQAGLVGGYNFQMGNVVAGLEIDSMWGDIDGSKTSGAVDADALHDWLSSMRFRLGYSFGSWMLYGTAGLAFSDFDIAAGTPGFERTKSETLFGYAVGAGVDYALTPNLSLKADVLYYGFEDVSVATPLGTLNADPDVTTFRAGVTYRFD